jgi:hypothetical protein
MPEGDGPSVSIPTASPTVDGSISKPDIVKQLLHAGKASDGGIVAQLTSNPFFTAVSLE